MPHYVVNNRRTTNPGLHHEVHKEGCDFFPDDFTDLGFHTDCHSALADAKSIYSNADGCIHCCPACHSG